MVIRLEGQEKQFPELLPTPDTLKRIFVAQGFPSFGSASGGSCLMQEKAEAKLPVKAEIMCGTGSRLLGFYSKLLHMLTM